jgi:signal transduction histidine kinase
MTDPDYVAAWREAHRAASGLDPEDAIPVVQIRSLMALPLTVREKPLGTITLYFEAPLSLRPAEMRLFQSFANILALAVYNTELVAQTSKLATVEERARLARELHDSVTQSLFSLNLTLKAARRNIDANPEKADKLLDNVQDLAQGALAEMRALIFELRPQALANEGLTSALEKHADSVKARSGLPVRLEINGDRRLPIETEEALYQIAREALHNVVKHSQATEAWVKLGMKGPDVTLSIRDNGRGFDTEKLKTDGGSHIGTSTMRERANAIGGTIEITSAPGSGTEVLVTTHVPLGSANGVTSPVEEAFTAPSQNGTRGTEVGV